MKKIIFGLSLLMSIVAFPLRASELNLGTTDSFGSANKDKHGKKVTVIIYQSLPHMGSKSKVVSVNR